MVLKKRGKVKSTWLYNSSEFISILNLAEKKFGSSTKRLAAEGWKQDWQVLIATILSAQTRDETTIPIAEKLFEEFYSLHYLANASEEEIFSIIKSINYNKSKSHHISQAARILLLEHGGKVPDTIEKLITLPGVGRKTANLMISEVFHKPSICVDTHVHRICNMLGFVKTKNPEETEYALKSFVPENYWSRINRLFVLWGKQVSGKDKKALLDALK